MIIIGFDPGSTCIGYGIIKWDHSKVSCLTYGTINYPGTHKTPCFLTIERELIKLLETHRPNAAGIESLFFSKNLSTGIAVSEIRGVIRLILARYSIPVSEFTPLQVKKCVTGYGRAEKRQIQHLVQLVLGLKKQIMPDDAADALAVALCCKHT